MGAGKSLANNSKQASILGAVAGAHYVRSVAPAYGIPCLVHSDHCAKKLLPWFDGMLEFDEQCFKVTGEPLFSSHILTFPRNLMMRISASAKNIWKGWQK